MRARVVPKQRAPGHYTHLLICQLSGESGLDDGLGANNLRAVDV